jgi:hypothetical protein
MIVSTVFGSENFPDSLSSLWVFSAKRGAPKVHLTTAIKDGVGGLAANGNIVNTPAHSMGHSHKTGRIFSGRFTAEPGAMLELYGMIKSTWMSNGHPARIILKAHPDAALVRITMDTLQKPTSNRDKYEIMGNFYVLTLEEAQAEGVDINPRQTAQYMEAAVGRLFNVEVLQPAVKEKPVLTMQEVVSEDGTVQRVASVRSRRALNL